VDCKHFSENKPCTQKCEKNSLEMNKAYVNSNKDYHETWQANLDLLKEDGEINVEERLKKARKVITSFNQRNTKKHTLKKLDEYYSVSNLSKKDFDKAKEALCAAYQM